MLKISKANAKLRRLYNVPELQRFLEGNRKVYSVSTLAGHTCPYAQDCFSKVVEQNGSRKVQDGPLTEFRCYSVSEELIFKPVYEAHKFNTELIYSQGTMAKMRDLILKSLPENLGIMRIHPDGDFRNQRYFDAWLSVAEYHPNKLFYAYTKSLPFWVKRMDSIPDNFILTASYGGRKDALIKAFNLRHSVVISNPLWVRYILNSENYDVVPEIPLCPYSGYAIDHNDSHAAIPAKRNENFALLVHGKQPKGSAAGKSLSMLKKAGGVGQYAR